MVLSSAETQQDNHQLIEIRKVKGDFATLNNYHEFRAEMLSMAIQPWFKTAFQDKDSAENIPESVWAMIACEKTAGSVSNLVLLAYEELDYSIASETAHPPESATDFDEWVAQFNPTSWGDWLMVPKLYLMHLRTGKNLLALTTTTDPWIDAVLRESRGMLMWSYQFIEITRMIAYVSITESNQMRTDWVMMKPEIKEMLGNFHYLPSRQTLLQILEERTVGMECLGSPDYFFADWLSKHYYSTNRINTICADEAC
ncbi:MAG: hypothetical protein Q7T42_08130 [Methylotenera sp.]|uniref:hypothetical protein n=1 Tax=Methylotenera sp. TaxID=2051956 RepID=UPI00271C972A|nr:hypothetical protein [Methylotenera sp.]MDO9393921.1 hypothetical protein [Methylotenera sp.]MDP1523322.1 hypothetical protein [Methylotenera sp.]